MKFNRKINLLIAVGLFVALSIGGAYAQEDKEYAIDKIYNPETATIHLDPNDPTLDVFFTKRDFSKDDRKAGPINVQRYDLSLAGFAFPTFYGLPIALTPEDLEAGNVEVAIVGETTVGTFGRTGATYAANYARLGEVLFPSGAYDNTIPEIMLDPFEELTIVDYGNIGNDTRSNDRTIQHSADIVEEIAKTGAVPILVGGDHAALYPHVVGIARAHGRGTFMVIHLDAHFDNSKTLGGHYVWMGSMNRLAVEEGWIKGEDMMQVGGRSPSAYDRDSVYWFTMNNAHLFMQAEIEQRGFKAVVKDIVEIVKNGPDKVYLSIDLDVMDAACVPAITGLELGGMTPRHLIELIRSIGVSADLIGVDFVEYIPTPGTSTTTT